MSPGTRLSLRPGASAGARGAGCCAQGAPGCVAGALPKSDTEGQKVTMKRPLRAVGKTVACCQGQREALRGQSWLSLPESSCGAAVGRVASVVNVPATTVWTCAAGLQCVN